jgi:hypothetical protein
MLTNVTGYTFVSFVNSAALASCLLLALSDVSDVLSISRGIDSLLIVICACNFWYQGKPFYFSVQQLTV